MGHLKVTQGLAWGFAVQVSYVLQQQIVCEMDVYMKFQNQQQATMLTENDHETFFTHCVTKVTQSALCQIATLLLQLNRSCEEQ